MWPTRILTYKRLTERYALDTVVLQLFHNDVVDQSIPDTRGVYNGMLYATPPKTALEKGAVRLLETSELLANLYYGWRLRAEPVPPLWLTPEFERAAAPQIRSTEALLEQWIREAHGRKQRFIVIWIPGSEQVVPGMSKQFGAQWRRSGQALDPDAAHRWLVRFLDGKPGVEYVDIVTPFRDWYAHHEGSLYFDVDGHTNAAGHRLIGETLLAALARRPPG